MRFGITVALLCATLTACAAEAGETSAKAERLYAPRELRSDFAEMYNALQSGNFDLYAFTAKSELDALYTRDLAALDRPMTQFDAKIRFEQFLANVHMGHTRVDFPYALWSQRLKDGGKAFPLAIRVVDGSVFVAQNSSGLPQIAAGDEILSLNGETMADWLTRAERHVSAETPYMAHSLMEYDFPIYVWVELGNVDDFDLDIRKADGKDQRLRLPARTAAEMKAFAAKQPPVLALEDRAVKILPGNIGYLRPGPFYNAEAKTDAEGWDTSAFKAFIDGAFERFNTAHARKLIIDLRGNPGGDNLFSDIMIAWFADRPFRFFSQFKVKVSPQSTAANRSRIEHDAIAAGPVSQQYAKLYAGAHNGDIVDFDMPLAPPRKGAHFDGKVFVLIDRQSYSNAVSVAALVQDYHFGTIVGEETSDMATAYGAMEQFTLPHTGIVVGYPKARIVRPNGDPKSRGVIPDIVIRTPVVPSRSDEVLQQAIAIAAR